MAFTWTPYNAHLLQIVKIGFIRTEIPNVDSLQTQIPCFHRKLNVLDTSIYCCTRIDKYGTPLTFEFYYLFT